MPYMEKNEEIKHFKNRLMLIAINDGWTLAHTCCDHEHCDEQDDSSEQEMDWEDSSQ